MKKWLCKLGLHKWYGQYRGSWLPASLYWKCERCPAERS